MQAPAQRALPRPAPLPTSSRLEKGRLDGGPRGAGPGKNHDRFGKCRRHQRRRQAAARSTPRCARTPVPVHHGPRQASPRSGSEAGPRQHHPPRSQGAASAWPCRRAPGRARSRRATRRRKLLEDAQKELQIVVDDANNRLKTVGPSRRPTPTRSERRCLENAKALAELDLALNLLDQAQAYPNIGKEEVDSGAPVPSTPGPGPLWRRPAATIPTTPTTGWPRPIRSAATSTPRVPTRSATISRPSSTATVPRPGTASASPSTTPWCLSWEHPEKDGPKVDVETAKWLRAYGAFKNTPEGCGIRFLRAESLLAHSETTKNAREKQEALDEARQLYTDLEHSESEYTDRAAMRRLLVIDRQGGFAKKPSELTSFDDRSPAPSSNCIRSARTPRTSRTKPSARRSASNAWTWWCRSWSAVCRCRTRRTPRTPRTPTPLAP